MDKIEKIRQEIERRRDFFYERYIQKGIGCIEETRYDECVEILSFIDSLPDCTVKTSGQGRVKDNVYDSLTEEKPSEDLTTEIEKYFQGLWPGMETAEQCNTDMHFTPPAIMRLARHFYELGKQAKEDLPEWKKAYAGTHFGEDVVTISPKGKDFPRVVETALTDCLYIPISELMKLAKKEN